MDRSNCPGKPRTETPSAEGNSFDRTSRFCSLLRQICRIRLYDKPPCQVALGKRRPCLHDKNHGPVLAIRQKRVFLRLKSVASLISGRNLMNVPCGRHYAPLWALLSPVHVERRQYVQQEAERQSGQALL